MDFILDFKDAPFIQEYKKANYELNEAFVLCRHLYQLVYDGLRKTDSGQFALFISDEDIKKLGESIKNFSEEISSKISKNPDEVFEQLLTVIQNNFIKTATSEEIKSRTFVDRNDASYGFVGTYYSFNDIPDWEEFKNRMRGLLDD